MSVDAGITESSPLRVGARLGGVVIAAVVIFALGVMVGKRVEESVPAFAPAPTALPTETFQPQPAAPRVVAEPIPPDTLTFYDRLSGVAEPPRPALPERQTAAGRVPAKTAATDPRAAAESQIRKLQGNGRFAVQITAVNDRSAADRAAARLKQDGFVVETVKAVVKGKVWYRIRVKPFPSRDAASKAAGIFHAAYGPSAIVVQD